MQRNTVSIAAALALALGLCTTAGAAVRDVFSTANPATACQLSIPTTDTEVRPKATGFRNESTTKSAFIICGYIMPTPDSNATFANIGLASLDGQAHTFNCTMVTGNYGFGAVMYATKAVTAPASGGQYTAWGPTDFGASGSFPGGSVVSITCPLPPQVTITFLQLGYKIDVGA